MAAVQLIGHPWVAGIFCALKKIQQLSSVEPVVIIGIAVKVHNLVHRQIDPLEVVSVGSKCSSTLKKLTLVSQW